MQHGRGQGSALGCGTPRGWLPPQEQGLASPRGMPAPAGDAAPQLWSKVGVGMLLTAFSSTRSLCLCPKWSPSPCAHGNGTGWIPGHSMGGAS